MELPPAIDALVPFVLPWSLIDASNTKRTN